MIKPKRKLFRWGPIDGMPLYPEYFMLAFPLAAKIFKPPWPDVLFYFSHERMICILDYQNLYDAGEENLKKYILNTQKRKKYFQLWIKQVKELGSFQKQVDDQDLKKLGDQQLLSWWQQWNKLYLNFWIYGLLPEISNWGGEQLLQRELEKHLKKPQDFVEVYEKLSAPSGLSFYQNEELVLLKLKLVKNKRLLAKKLHTHQRKYYWLHNSYHHTEVLTAQHFKKELQKTTLVQARKKIKQISQLPKQVAQIKERVVRKYQLSKAILEIAKNLGYTIWWQDSRKSYIFIANHYIDVFLREFFCRFKVTFRDLHYYQIKELERLVSEKTIISKKEIKARFAADIIYYSEKPGTIKYFTGARAEKIYQPFISSKKELKKQELQGLVVSRGQGNVTGRIRILKSAKEHNKMKAGEILVTSMTSPDFILAIRKAKAIITDEGGMTCHAAIVARELNIPCIVKTDIATKVLKDGDQVEVDAEKGVVKKL